MKIKPVKGQPMLHWVGKHPFDICFSDVLSLTLSNLIVERKIASNPLKKDLLSIPKMLYT